MITNLESNKINTNNEIIIIIIIIIIINIDNLLKNPSFNSDDFLSSNNWNRLEEGYMPDIPRVDDNLSSPFGSILMSNSFVDETDLNLNVFFYLFLFIYLIFFPLTNLFLF